MPVRLSRIVCQSVGQGASSFICRNGARHAWGPLGRQERSVQSEFHLQRNQCDGALHPKWMLGEADSIRSLNQKPSVLGISIKGWNEFRKKRPVTGVREEGSGQRRKDETSISR